MKQSQTLPARSTSKGKHVLTAGMILLLASAQTALANSAPVVSNVTASQRTDGSKKVDVGYNLADADGDACVVTVQASNDGGATWTVPITAVTGHVGSGITPGTGKLIVWDCPVDLPGAFGSQYQVRVCAADAPTGMVPIHAGQFQMGNSFDPSEGYSHELPQHWVYVDAFYMDKYQVTNQQYAEALNWARNQGGHITVTDNIVYQAGSGTSYPYCSTTRSSSYSRITWNGTNFGVVNGYENHPMEYVSWYGAVAFANWRSAMQGKPLCYNLSTWACNFSAGGYRLPTEAEWEKAARGGAAGRRFPWSDSDYIQHARANYFSYWSGGAPYYSYDTSPTQGYHPTFIAVSPYTSPVGYFAPNGYGLYDMTGNVFEWCNDRYSSTYYSSSPYNNPRGPTSGTDRVLRGGCWGRSVHTCRVASRGYSTPDFWYLYFGFRLALGTE